MDLLDFEGQDLYFDEPLPAGVEELLQVAADTYAEGDAEHHLLRAYFKAPEHLVVLVALYRFYYYQHAYPDALTVADRALALVGQQLSFPQNWEKLNSQQLATASELSMGLTRFYLLALKGAGYLYLRLGKPQPAFDRLQKVKELDTDDRLGTSYLLDLAHKAVTRDKLSLVTGAS